MAVEIDQVGHQQGHQDPVSGGADVARPGPEAGPLDRHGWLVADGVAVVAGWDVEDVVGRDLEGRPVAQLEARPSRQLPTDMVRLAPLRPHGLLHVQRPAPAGLGDDPCDSEVTDLDRVLARALELDSLLRLSQALGVGHAADASGPTTAKSRQRSGRPMTGGCASCGSTAEL